MKAKAPLGKTALARKDAFIRLVLRHVKRGKWNADLGRFVPDLQNAYEIASIKFVGELATIEECRASIRSGKFAATFPAGHPALEGSA